MERKTIISIQHLSKTYIGSINPAIDNMTLSISEKEVFGILGPNGAGKTTLISILCGLFPPSSGKVLINGLNYSSNRKVLKNMIGIVPQDIALYPTLTANENLRFFGVAYGLDANFLNQRINECIGLLGMEKYIDKKINTFSGGMKRRINIIAGILHKPHVLFLDEPTVGIDVHSKKIIIDYLTELNKNGTTIIYTSHLMNEAENFCSCIAIIDNGKIVTIGTPSDLIEKSVNLPNLESIFLQLTKNNE